MKTETLVLFGLIGFALYQITKTKQEGEALVAAAAAQEANTQIDGRDLITSNLVDSPVKQKSPYLNADGTVNFGNLINGGGMIIDNYGKGSIYAPV